MDTPTFISVEEAFDIIKSRSRSFGIEKVGILEATGRVIAEPLIADRPFPPYDRVAMDGIAINYLSFTNGNRIFKIEAISPAGTPQKQLETPSNCIETMTGSILPIGCDTIIRYEDLDIKEGIATIIIDEILQGQNIHQKGKDVRVNEILVRPGSIITPEIIGVAATIGKAELTVNSNPKVIIISTGDELVDIDTQPLPYQIRKSNVYVINSILTNLGIQPHTQHLNDDFDTMTVVLDQCLNNYDLIIMSGGVSMGKFDYIPKAMKSLGVTPHFHKISQRPGKPLWFGTHDSGATIFALPGNPISTTMTTYIYLKYWLHISIGLAYPFIYAELERDVVFKPDLTYFLEVVLQYHISAKITASPKKSNGSGDLANLIGKQGFMELVKGKTTYSAGEVYKVYLI